MLYFSSKGSLAQYIPESRNFLKNDRNKNGKNRNVFRGRHNIVNFIDKLPKTKHDLGSFLIDVPLANVSVVLLLFKFFFLKQLLQFFSKGYDASDCS